MGDHRDCGAEDSGPNGPYMEIRHPVVVFSFDAVPDLSAKVLGPLPVEQNRLLRGGAPGPAEDQKGACNTRKRIDLRKAGILGDQKRNDRKYGGQSIGENMKVGGAQVVIVVVGIVVSLVFGETIREAENEHGDAVHDQSRTATAIAWLKAISTG